MNIRSKVKVRVRVKRSSGWRELCTSIECFSSFVPVLYCKKQNVHFSSVAALGRWRLCVHTLYTTLSVDNHRCTLLKRLLTPVTKHTTDPLVHACLMRLRTYPTTVAFDGRTGKHNKTRITPKPERETSISETRRLFRWLPHTSSGIRKTRIKMKRQNWNIMMRI